MSMPYMLIGPEKGEPADEWIRLGLERHLANQLPAAAAYYNRALQVDPRNVVATLDLGILHAQTGNLNEGLLTIERALVFEPDHANCLQTRAMMCLAADRIDDALAAAKRAHELKPNIDTRLALALILATAGLGVEAVPLYNQILDEKPDHPLAAPNACFVQTLTDVGPKELLWQRKRWHDAFAFKGEKRPHRIDRTWPRPLRVGYLSGDFKSHSAAMIFRNVLTRHDPKVVEPYFYSTLPIDPTQDAFTKAFVEASGGAIETGKNEKGEAIWKIVGGRWRDIKDIDDEKAEDLIRADKIDILVELSGHTGGSRLQLMTRKPAPVGATAWGFAHGTGCPEIDYFMACPVAVPEGERSMFAERIADLPCIITYEEPTWYNIANSDVIPFRQNGYITFGSSSRYEKLSAECLKTFGEILRRVPDSVLRLKDSAFRRPYSINRVTSAMPDIDPKRIQFLINSDHRDHMMSYRQSDIALDPFPHGGGVVAVEQLYMGVPLVTLRGRQPAGRNNASILTAMGRPEWIAENTEQYIEIAVKLADDPKTLRDARKNLRTQLLESPVVKGYAQAVEAAYVKMWERKLEESP